MVVNKRQKWQSRVTGNIGKEIRWKRKLNHNTICVGYHSMQRNTNNANKTWDVRQTTGGTSFICGIVTDISIYISKVRYFMFCMLFLPQSLQRLLLNALYGLFTYISPTVGTLCSLCSSYLNLFKVGYSVFPVLIQFSS